MAPPQNIKQLRRFLGGINFCRRIREYCTNILTLLTSLTRKVKFTQDEEQQKAYDEIKTVIAKKTLLCYPDFNAEFHACADASDSQLGSIIIQHRKPVAFFSRKLNSYQKKYGVSEKELLSINEILKEFYLILCGLRIIIYTDYKNLTYSGIIHENARTIC